MKTCGDLLGLAAPQVMKLMIGYVESYAYSQENSDYEHTETWKGYFYAVFLLVVTCVQTLCNAKSSEMFYRTAMNLVS